MTAIPAITPSAKRATMDCVGAFCEEEMAEEVGFGDEALDAFKVVAVGVAVDDGEIGEVCLIVEFEVS